MRKTKILYIKLLVSIAGLFYLLLVGWVGVSIRGCYQRNLLLLWRCTYIIMLRIINVRLSVFLNKSLFTYFTRVILKNNLETLIFPPGVIKIACYKKARIVYNFVSTKQYRHIHVHVDITPVPDRGFVLCAILGLCVLCVLCHFFVTMHIPFPFGVLVSKIWFLHNILFS